MTHLLTCSLTSSHIHSLTHTLFLSLTHLTHSLSTLITTLPLQPSSGQGRTLAGEDLLVRRLNEAGAAATKCCDYAKTSFEEQITLVNKRNLILTNLLLINLIQTMTPNQSNPNPD